jgi:hypothetical protein
MTMSIGEDRVRVKFNPSDNSVVAQIKQKTAELINICHENKPTRQYGANPEVERLWKFAEFLFEDGAMWAVKAATSEAKP